MNKIIGSHQLQNGLNKKRTDGFPKNIFSLSFRLNMGQTFLFCLFSFYSLTAQITSNSFLEKEVLSLSASLPDTNTSYRFYLDKHLFDYLGTDSFGIGIDLNAAYQSGAISYYSNYEDNLSYLVSPYLHYQFIPSLSFDVRVNVENLQDQYLYPQRPYYSDNFSNHRGGFEIAKVSFENKYITVKFGRDFFLPGYYFYERLLFSSLNYPYDQIYLSFHNRYFELSTFYLSLNPVPYEGNTYQRHFNGHKLSFNLKNGYIAFTDIMLYGGVNQPIDPLLFNPLMLLYPYRKNKKNMDGNNIMMMEMYYNYHAYYIFVEFLLDDFQVDKETPEDLEPPEWGLNVTVGKEQLFKDMNWKINYTHVANRTFNAPNYDYEKYIYKNYPIGHWLGNNFWEIKTSLTYKGIPGLLADLTISHAELGEEALYGPFNKDYLDHTVEEGYEEDFPFGPIRLQTGASFKVYYNVIPNLLIKSALSYWLQNSHLKNDFAIMFGAAYHL